MVYLVLLPLFFGVMLLYFKIADHYNIIDRPNERSSHSTITIRGGGVIFVFAAIVALMLHINYWQPVLGIFTIGVISFLDDRHTLSGRVRIIFHLTSVTLLFSSLHLFSFLPFYECLFLYILVIGIINAYNFMDGINGITGTYSLVVLLGIQYVNLFQYPFIHPDMVWLPLMACSVFLYYNFRRKAKCFAGDVGSVSIAFWVVFLLLKLMTNTHNFAYILFLAVYGVDAVLTIIHRIILKQNIFKAHRLHFYQILVNEHRLPHLIVAVIYAMVQLFIVVIVINSKALPVAVLFFVIVAPLVSIYLWLKPLLMNRAKKMA